MSEFCVINLLLISCFPPPFLACLLFGFDVVDDQRQTRVENEKKRGMKERMKCLQDERELRSNHHSFVRSNSRETRRQQHKPTRDGGTTQHKTTQHKRTTRTTEEGVSSLRHPSLTRVEREKETDRETSSEREQKRRG